MIYGERVSDGLHTYIVEVGPIDRPLKVVVWKVSGDRVNTHSHLIDARS